MKFYKINIDYNVVGQQNEGRKTKNIVKNEMQNIVSRQ